MKWGVEKRLEFIEFRLFWEGGINRSDLVDQFGISIPQASKDLSLYQERAPENMRYDPQLKRYFAERAFMLRFLDPNPDIYLSQLRSIVKGGAGATESWIALTPQADLGLMPKRDIDISVLRSVLRAVREELSIEMLYQSMSPERPDPEWRQMTPHAFGYDGNRWHVRAFCHSERSFRDFLLPRIIEVGSFGEKGADASTDWSWNNFFKIELAPHPKLTDSQKRVVAKDYGFSDGIGVLTVRYAMLFYMMKGLGLLDDGERKDPRRQHIVARNHEELQDALAVSEKIQRSSGALVGDLMWQ